MDDRKIDVFLSVVEHGSFGKAAKEQNCTQSAVTQMMNSLEEELGLKLLKRTTSGTKLTQAGEQMLPSLRKIANAYGQMNRQAALLREGKTVPIRIGTFSSIANTWLPKILGEYQKLHPDVAFTLKIGTGDLAEYFANGKIDVAFGDEVRCMMGRWYPLMQDPYYAVLPKTHPDAASSMITQEKLATYPLIATPENVLERYFEVLSKNQLSVSTDDDTMLFSLISQGLGVSAIPNLSLKKVPEDLAILKLSPQPERIIGMAISLTPTQAVREFASYVKQYHEKQVAL